MTERGDGPVQTPDGTDSPVAESNGDDGTPAADGAVRPDRESSPPVYAPPEADSFDWQGWVLVVLVVVCFLVIPGTILLLPGARAFLGSLGLSLRDAYLTLPLIPAIVLGAVAVWTAVASRRR